ncbi:MAG TPA: CerR family C-terminal domain-containing protein [Bryobacteraceae bacterium]|jgi:AcrR family transcriptional regulator|nr:CerR family C-terminal domain-containing protein [Bryobacteraceae bacterium]
MSSQAKRHTPHLDAGTRAKLVDAAGQVFAESGYQGATVREICARAGVNVALVNYYFGDKLELYAEVLRESIGSMKDEIKALESGLPPEEALRDLIRATLQRIFRAGRPGWHYQIMVHEIKQPTPAMENVINETMKPLYKRFCGLIGTVLALSPDDDKVKLCTHSIIAQVFHYAHARYMNSILWAGLEMTPDRVIQVANHIADFSLAYLRQEAPAAYLRQEAPPQPRGRARVRNIARKNI